MGKPAKRQTCSTHARSGVGHRYVTKELINWLNKCYPLSGIDTEGWISRSCSAITSQQQTTGFDCGVATLLYAEKCGQVHSSLVVLSSYTHDKAEADTFSLSTGTNARGHRCLNNPGRPHRLSIATPDLAAIYLTTCYCKIALCSATVYDNIMISHCLFFGIQTCQLQYYSTSANDPAL